MAHRAAGGVHAARVPADVGAAAPPALLAVPAGEGKGCVSKHQELWASKSLNKCAIFTVNTRTCTVLC